MRFQLTMASAVTAAALFSLGRGTPTSAAQQPVPYVPTQVPRTIQTSPVVSQRYRLYVYPTRIPRVYVNPAPLGSTYFPWYFEHYHIRDWTTGIEKPSYSVSKPWLNVRQYP